MGRKKFHLVVRKNEERKKYATLTSLIVSVPTAKLPVQDLGTMVSQLKTSNALPQTWIVQAAVPLPKRRRCCSYGESSS